MSFQWFRMWTDAMDDEKLKLLAFEDRWHFVALLCCKRKGILDAPDDAAMRDRKVGAKLGLADRERDEVRRRLIDVRLIDEDWQPLAWGKRQFVSDADPTARDRKRKQRDKGRHGRVTRDKNVSHGPVTDESHPSHAPQTQTQTQTQTTDSEKNKNRIGAAAPRRVDVEPPVFVEIRREYPRRSGGQRWGDALKFFQRRLSEGEQAEVILAGVKRYAVFARASGIERTERVQQVATFLGDNRSYLEQWHPPPRAQSAVERAREKLQESMNGGRVVGEQEGGSINPGVGALARVLR